MTKATPDPEAVSMSANDQTVLIEMRWRDLDHQGHVFHGEYLTLLDEARTRWLENVVRLPDADSHVVARLEINYLSPLTRPDKAVRVDFQIERIGNTSITLGEKMSSHTDGTAAAESTTTLVFWDPSTNRPKPLSTENRQLLAPHLSRSQDTPAMEE